MEGHAVSARGAARLLALLVVLAPVALAQTPTTPPPPTIVVPPPAPTLPPIVQGSPDVELLAPAAPIPAKERVNVFVGVLNRGPGAIRDVEALVQPAGTEGLVVVGQLLRGLDDLPENESGVLLVRVATPDTAGGATLTVTFRFTDETGSRHELTRAVSLQIAPPRSDPLQVVSDAQQVAAGGDEAIALRIVNQDRRPVTSLDVFFQPDDAQAVELGGDEELAPGPTGSQLLRGARLEPGEGVSVAVPALTSRTPEDVVSYRVLLRYTLDGFAREQSLTFGTRLEGETRLRVLEARVERVGDGLALTGTLVNTGTATAWNPRVSTAPGAGYRADAPVLIEDLEPNEGVDFRIPVERAGDSRPGAKLLVVDWNDADGEVHEAPVEGEATPPPPAPASLLERARELALSPLAWGVALALLVAVAAVAAWRHMHRVRAEDEAREEAPAAAGRDAVRERQRTGRRARPGP